MAKEEHRKGEQQGSKHRIETHVGGEHHGMPEMGAKTSKTARHAHWISSVQEHESHPGESLATRNHDVIMRWAEERKAIPATVPGTSHEGRPGVLGFDFPGYGGRELRRISWDEWFKSFDDRKLTFIFQEHTRDGKMSNFFHLDSPEREHD